MDSYDYSPNGIDYDPDMIYEPRLRSQAPQAPQRRGRVQNGAPQEGGARRRGGEPAAAASRQRRTQSPPAAKPAAGKSRKSALSLRDSSVGKLSPATPPHPGAGGRLSVKNFT
ncbi:MAG: hypothetical protein K2O10_03965, partial [Muribaculaceae bacterium]|nr:hypothetical protein [Muribaculaceae bacterium]